MKTLTLLTPFLYVLDHDERCSASLATATSTARCSTSTPVVLVSSTTIDGRDYTLQLPMCPEHAGAFRSTTGKTARDLHDYALSHR